MLNGARLRLPVLNKVAALVALAVTVLLGVVARPAAEAPPPPPESVLGFAPCADYSLATSEQIAAYLRALDASSDRMQLFDIGPTTEGRRQLLALISSEENLRQLARYKTIARALALNRDASGAPLTDDAARRLARDGKTMVWVNFGLHSNEVAHAQAAPLVAWTMVTGDTPEIRQIREKTILVLVPDMNPDGTTMIANWYRDHRGEPWEMTLPELYQRYVGHDNNRDWFMFTQQESRNAGRQLYEEYFPQIVYDHHQTAPFPARIFVPPFVEPTNVHIPALVLRGIETLGTEMQRRFQAEGKSGAISRIGFDTWWNGGMRTAPYFHNMVGILTETAHASPTPADLDASVFPRRFANGQSTIEATADYPQPYRGGRWTMRQSCDYMLSASLAVMSTAAARSDAWQYDMYQMARDAMRAGAHETYVIPASQWDAGAATRMVNALRTGGVTVLRATAPFSAGGRTYGSGSFIIPGAQPFLPYVRDLLGPQQYPERRTLAEGVPETPYDISGWTLNLQMGVEVDKIAEAIAPPTERVTAAVAPAWSLTGSGAMYAFDPRTNDAFTAVNRLLKAGARVFRATDRLQTSAGSFPPGAFLVSQDSVSRRTVMAAASSLGLQVVGMVDPDMASLVPLSSPRVGLYRPWGGNTDEGWTRWVLEQYEFAYTTLRDDAVRAGNLRASFDVIVLPDATYGELLTGVASGSLPEQYTGGLTERGVRRLREFVVQGGTLVAHDRAGELPLRAFGLPFDNGLAALPRDQFYVPGTLLRLSIDNHHPLGWGLPAQVAAFFAESPAFTYRAGPQNAGSRDAGSKDPAYGPTEKGTYAGRVFRPATAIVASYPDEDLTLSGWALGERHLRSKAAVVDAPLGAGRVVLLGFVTQHRGQAHGTFKLLFNALYRAQPVSR